MGMSTVHCDAFRRMFGLLSNAQREQRSYLLAMSDLYIQFNTDRFKGDSHGVFIQSFQGEKRTLLSEDVKAVMDNEQLFVPHIPPKDYFRNIEEEIEYFDDEYDEFVQRIEQKHE